MDKNKTKQAKASKTWILVAGLVIFTAVILIISIKSTANPISSIPTPSPSGETVKDVAQTSLGFANFPRVSSASGTYEIDININSNQNQITLAQLEMSYDPKLLIIYDIKPGNFLNNPVVIQKNIDPANGKIKYWLGIDPNQKAVAGKGVIAVVSFTKVGTAPAQIIFLPKTSVSASGVDQSVLRNTAAGVITTLPQIIRKLK